MNKELYPEFDGINIKNEVESGTQTLLHDPKKQRSRKETEAKLCYGSKNTTKSPTQKETSPKRKLNRLIRKYVTNKKFSSKIYIGVSLISSL